MALDLRTPQGRQPSARPRLQWRARTGVWPREQSIVRSCRLFVGEHGKSQSDSATIRGTTVRAIERGRDYELLISPRLRGLRLLAEDPSDLTASASLVKAWRLSAAGI